MGSARMTIAAEVGRSRKIVQLIPPIIMRRANFASCVAIPSLSSLRSTVLRVCAMRPNGRRKIVLPRFSAPIAPSTSMEAIVMSTTSPAFEIVVSASTFGVTRPTRLSPGLATCTLCAKRKPWPLRISEPRSGGIWMRTWPRPPARTPYPSAAIPNVG